MFYEVVNMNNISSWIISIAGVICLSVLLELIIPDGQMNKYVKNIFSFVIILVIILPIPNLINNVNLDNLTSTNYENIYLQENYLSKSNKNKLNAINEDLISYFNEAGYSEISIQSILNTSENIDDIEIFVDLTNIVISENKMNKNILEIKEELNQIIINYIGDVEVKYNE